MPIEARPSWTCEFTTSTWIHSMSFGSSLPSRTIFIECCNDTDINITCTLPMRYFVIDIPGCSCDQKPGINESHNRWWTPHLPTVRATISLPLRAMSPRTAAAVLPHGMLKHGEAPVQATCCERSSGYRLQFIVPNLESQNQQMQDEEQNFSH